MPRRTASAAKKRSRPLAARSKRSSTKKTAKKKRASDGGMPAFVPPQLCTSVERPPAGGGWVHEIKFDGYRIQMRVENGAVTLKTRKGLDWTAKFGSAIPTAASELPDCLIDGEIVALDHRGSPDFAGLQAALSEGKTDDLIFFAFDLLFLEGEDLRSRSLVDRKTRSQEPHREGLRQASGRDPICRAFRERRRRRPQVRLPDVPGRHRLEASGRALRFGAQR